MRTFKSLSHFFVFITGLFNFSSLFAQPTFPENGVADPRQGHYAFINATIVKAPGTVVSNATLIIKDGKIVAVGANLKLPGDAVVIDCKGKYIYPSFIDIYADYGIPEPQRSTEGSGGFFARQQLESTGKSAYGWNQSIKADENAYAKFAVDEKKAEPLRNAGFGIVLTHVKDGIARGTGTLVTLANQKANLVMIADKASAHYSFNKGSSTQAYPGSMMGSIALLRQTFLDAQWYKTKPTAEGINLSLQAWNDMQNLPQLFEANDKWNCLRADKIGDEFDVQYILKAGQNEYQRIQEMKASKAVFIVPLNFPQAQDVEDPNQARFVALQDMKHWEMAPVQAAAFEKANIPFCLTTADLKSPSLFLTNLRKSFEYGLTETKALEALTTGPAAAIKMADKIGTLDAGKLANFLITSGPVFNEKTIIFQNWIQGIKYTVKDDAAVNKLGTYALLVNHSNTVENYTLEVKSPTNLIMYNKDTLQSKFNHEGTIVKLSYAPGAKQKTDASNTRGSAGLPSSAIHLSGINNGNEWNGTGIDSLGNSLTWTAKLIKAESPKETEQKKKEIVNAGKVIYPFVPFGWEEGNAPKQETILIKNTTVWTNEANGILNNTDVLLRDGKIATIGKNLSAPAGAKMIDGAGKHLTAGIIDEHSHIAAASINEGGQSVTSEVRIGDNINPDDVNIYRQLSGGVTCSHILHGSANVIGGQTQLLKMRWGANAEEMKFKNWIGQIKFALGENVKRSAATQGNVRYPDTRMGVEQILVDAFTRAKDYKKLWTDYATSKAKSMTPRRDLELDALVEILEEKRYITCHSYVQSEITGSIEVAKKMGYKYNTFTHILEGYKVADKMKAHGANASTFADWWAYKMEVQDAIPYNAALMHKVGLNVAINSDDAEMARRLNQEAAKIVKYGGVTEEEALKMVTLNPAKMLHVEDKVGSIKIGKDADVVVWSDHPLSIYAKSLYTIVDGIIYFDREKDAQMQKAIDAERNRLVRKMIGEKKGGASVSPPQPSYQIMHTCCDQDHHQSLLTIYTNDL